MQIAAVGDIFQMGADESEIGRRNTLSVWVRVAAADDETKMRTIFMAAAKPQIGGKATELADGVVGIFAEACAVNVWLRSRV